MKEREREREHSERALLSKQSANDIEEIALLMRGRSFFQCCRHKMSASAPFQKQKASDDQTSAINKNRTPHLLSLYLLLLLLFLEDEEKNRDLYVCKYIKVECAVVAFLCRTTTPFFSSLPHFFLEFRVFISKSEKGKRTANNKSKAS